jgi:hypothetical protein
MIKSFLVILRSSALIDNLSDVFRKRRQKILRGAERNQLGSSRLTYRNDGEIYHSSTRLCTVMDNRK